jgi:hypothetical protein
MMLDDVEECQLSVPIGELVPFGPFVGESIPGVVTIFGSGTLRDSGVRPRPVRCPSIGVA